MNTPVQILLFGGMRVLIGTRTVTRFRTQKAGALLAYLALFRGRSHPREELADLFWPDLDVHGARSNLRGALAILRRELETGDLAAGSVVVTEGYQSVHLHPENVTSDVREFETALGDAETAPDPAEQAACLGRSVEAYAGPLLPDLADMWAQTERDRLAAAFHRAADRLTAYWEGRNDLDRALHYARLSAEADPSREEGQAAVLRLLARAGQVEAALTHYRQVEASMGAQRSGRAPSAELQELAARLRAGRPVPKPALDGETGGGAAVVAAPAAAAAPRLPATLNRFFGREDEREALRRLLREGEARLITVTGPGGGGKTRLAVEAARGMADAFPGGLWFVPLADLREAEGVPDAVVAAMGLPAAAGGTPALDRVAGALNAAPAPALLVLDNFEHLADGGGDVLAELLGGVPHLSLLVTSRQRLLLEGEREFPLLPLPAPGLPGTPERLLEFPSVALFVDRARAARPDFALTPRNADAVSALCARLDGMPLAIELAAAWSPSLTPSQMLQRMGQRFDLLVSRRRDVPLRHRTLRAAIETSIELLRPELRRFFARLAVFRGGWTLEAAEAVCGAADAMTLLAELRDRSLIVAEESGEDLRYRMLETLREFAGELLGEETAEFIGRHRHYFLHVAEEAATHMSGPQQKDWFDRLEADHDNFRAAQDRIADDPEAGLRLVVALWRFWSARGHFTEGRRRVAEALGRSRAEDTPVQLRARAWNAAASLAGAQGDLPAAERHLAPALELSRAAGDNAGAAGALCSLAIIAKHRGEYARSADLLAESIPLSRAAGDLRATCRAVQTLGNLLVVRGDLTEARTRYEEALELSEQMGDRKQSALILFNLGYLASRLGDDDGQKTYYERSLEVRRELNDVLGIAISLQGLGTALRMLGDREGALRCYEESLMLHRRAQDEAGTVLIHLNRAQMGLDATDASDAWGHLLQGLALLRSDGNRRYVAEGLGVRARLAGRTGEPEKAARWWGAAHAILEALGITPTAHESRDMEQGMAAVRATLGAAAFDAAFEGGRRLSHEEALAEASAPPARFEMTADSVAGTLAVG